MDDTHTYTHTLKHTHTQSCTLTHRQTHPYIHWSTDADEYESACKCVHIHTHTHTLTDTNSHGDKQAQRQLCPHKHTSWSYLNLATHTHTHTHTHKQTNCPDGIWLCDLRSVVWGSLLLNPLNALGFPPSSSLSLSLLYLPPSVLLYGWMNTYHSADKEPSTLELALSLRAMFTPRECSAFHRCFIDRIHLIRRRWERGVEASFSAAKTSDTHAHTRSSTPSILTLQAGQLSHIYHIFMFGEAELGGKINHDSLMGITVSRILAQNTEHEGRNNKINPQTPQSMEAAKFQHRFSSDLIESWQFSESTGRQRESEREEVT